MYVFSHRDIIYVSARGPKLRDFHSEMSTAVSLFSSPIGARIDQSDYAQQRDDCCEAIYDFSPYLFQVVDTMAASLRSDQDSVTEESGETDAISRLGKEKLSARVLYTIYIDILILWYYPKIIGERKQYAKYFL